MKREFSINTYFHYLNLNLKGNRDNCSVVKISVSLGTVLLFIEFYCVLNNFKMKGVFVDTWSDEVTHQQELEINFLHWEDSRL